MSSEDNMDFYIELMRQLLERVSFDAARITSRTGKVLSIFAKTRSNRAIFFSGRGGANLPRINSPGRRVERGGICSGAGAEKRSTFDPVRNIGYESAAGSRQM